MYGLVRKIIIFATVDGLILQPVAQKGQRSPPTVRIGYGDGSISSSVATSSPSSKTFEAFGVVGLINVSRIPYLISITRRQQVAQIRGIPVYVISEVAITPISSKKEAEDAIAATHATLQKRTIDGHSIEDDISDSDIDEVPASASDDVDEAMADSTIPNILGTAQRNRASSVAEDVMTRKGGYGMFAQRWFSKKGWAAGQRRNLGMSADSSAEKSTAPLDASVTEEVQQESELAKASQVNATEEQMKDNSGALLPKLLKTAQILFGTSRSFYFSYDYDITKSLGSTKSKKGSEVPLYKDVDPLFFWNRSMINPFIDAGVSPFVLPLMQGFVGQQSFTVEKYPAVAVPEFDKKSNSDPPLEMKEMSPDTSRSGMGTNQDFTNSEEPDRDTSDTHHTSLVDESRNFLLTLISRRSVKRAGLRYLRRGVDENGDSANSVETEQVLSDPNWSPKSKTYSFLQIRGSIPIFFSQSPYSFKPIPQLQHSEDTNFRAFYNHFSNLSARYGSIVATSLVEKHGPEAIVGGEYSKYMTRLNEAGGIKGSKVDFEWFDFHAMCRGMKYENVSLLMDTIGPILDKFSYSVEHDGKLDAKQSGVLRTNCMDCLDRTNVVQSAFGRRALEIQLKEEGIDLTAQADQNTAWFNNMWADNGDAISKQYASTAALKGDFTRTRKRDFKGALNDMSLSISRFYSGIVNDYFSQAAIDFFVGNVTSLVFEDFQATLSSEDPSVSMHKMRQQAIEVSQHLVVADQTEEFIGGWTLLTPHLPNTIKSTPFEESVLLLTDVAVYACRFDWNIEKVSSFERVDLRHINNIKYGTFITSTLSAAQADEKRNVGFVITYTAGENEIARVNTRSMSTSAPSRETADLLQGSAVSTALSGILAPKKLNTKILTFKALSARSAVAQGQDLPRMTEMEQVKHICMEIEGVAVSGKADPDAEPKNLLDQSDIITLTEAKRQTGLLEQLGYSIKKMVWA